MNNKSMLISVIVPVKNGEKHLPAFLASLQTINRPDVEVIVIDDGSTDSTAVLLAKHPQIITIRTAGVGPSQARNLGIAKANGEYIAFTDADCIVAPDWLDALLQGFSDSAVAGVGGDQQSPPDDSSFGALVHAFLKTVGFVADYIKVDGAGIIETKHNPTCNVMYRKKALEDAGGFLSGLWPGEDLELDYRLRKKGWKFMYNPRAIVYHYRPATLAKFIRMMFSYGSAQGFLVHRYGLFRFLHVVPLFFAGLLAFLIALPFLIISKILLALFLLSYLFFIMRTKKFIISIRYVFLLFMALFFWNAGFYKRFISA